MSYLRFKTFDSPSKKTKIVDVISINHGNILGSIRWYGQWRQYAFYPNEGTIWNRDCMQEIQDRITVLMDERK